MASATGGATPAGLLRVSTARPAGQGEARCHRLRNRPLPRSQKLSNQALAAVRAPVEHGFAHLKN